MFENLTVLTPIKETADLTEWYRSMSWLLDQTKWLILDSGGGEAFSNVDGYQKLDVSEWRARELLIRKIETPFVLNLDCLNVLPEAYVKEAYTLLSNNGAEVTAIDYEESIGHYGFGTSMWKTPVLRAVYDYPPKALRLQLQDEDGEFHVFRYTICECIYLWNKLYNNGNKFLPLLFKAKNLGASHE